MKDILAYQREWRRKRRPPPDPDLPGEAWRDVLDGRYAVSDMGRIKRATYAPGARAGKVLKLYLNNWGYLDAHVSLDGHPTAIPFHRLVATAFIRPPTEGECVNHIDGTKTNNVPANLEWVTFAENLRHAQRTGLSAPPVTRRGSAHGNAKLTEDAVREIRAGKGKIPAAQLAAQFGVKVSTIYTLHGRSSWKHVT